MSEKSKMHVAIGKENHIGTEVAGTWPLRAKCGVKTIDFFKTERDLTFQSWEPCVECFSEEEFVLFLLGNI
jgi:hypothetical protein